MKTPLCIVLLLVAAFTSATRLEGWRESWAGTALRDRSLTAAVMGESRRMFANHFFVKADAYFHSGYYPTIFDNGEAFQTPHISGDAGATADRNVGDEHGFLGPPRDWIDRFNRRFIPTQHTHLDERHADSSGTSQAGGEGGEARGGEAREMLPWLRVSLELDPHRVETYLVAAFWLRERMGRAEAAEALLREGLMANPDSFELLFELGRIALETRQDPARARHLWEAGLTRWDRQERGKPDPDYFMRHQLLANLSRADEATGNIAAAYAHLQDADETPGGKGLYTIRLERLRNLVEHGATPEAPASTDVHPPGDG